MYPVYSHNYIKLTICPIKISGCQTKSHDCLTKWWVQLFALTLQIQAALAVPV